MDTRDTRPSHQSPVSQDDGGLCLKTDSSTVTNPTGSQSVTCGEKLQDEAKVIPHAPAQKTKYYNVMDDEGVDDVFIPPPQSRRAPLLSEEGSTDAMALSNPTVTLSEGAADATEAKANPSGLDWHHGEKQLMAAHNEVDEVKAQTSKESMDPESLSKDHNQKPMEVTGSLTKTCPDPSGGHHPDNKRGDEESAAETEVIFSGRQENWRESEEERDKYPKQVPSSTEDNSGNKTHFDKEVDKTKSKDICGPMETDSKLPTKNVYCDSMETNAPTLSSLSKNGDDLEVCGPPELCKCSQNKMEAGTNQPQVPELPTEASSDGEVHVDTRSLDYNLTKYNWVRRASGETQVPQLPIFEGSEESVAKGEQEDEGRRIASEIQQGQQLLQRLQQVQLRQDVNTSHVAEVDDVKARGGGLTGGNEREESRSYIVEDDEGKTNLMEKKKNEKNQSKDLEAKARMSVEPEHHTIARTEVGDSDDDQTDSWVPADLSSTNPHEASFTENRFPSFRHRLSAAETPTEKQIHEAAQEKQNLQRTGGLFNLADNPDVLEIPFKTNVSLDPLTTSADPGQHSDWQFSEQKMQKEISQEIQRELVLVNQGKIPGGYNKGEVRQLKETKLLFEAFQQDTTEGPTRHRKSPILMKGHIYPSVLERTRSLEMFSLKTHPVARAHSLRLYKSTSEAEKSPEDFRSKSPTGGSRDKSRLFPYPKQDKHTRLHRSMDSISADVSKSAEETGSKTRGKNTSHESPILKHNPFCKLRPALALQPEVEKDIREAKEREEELRRQRCTLYGENRQNSQDGEKSQIAPLPEPDIRRQSRGKLERVWPPPSKKDQTKSEQTQQEPKVHRPGGQKALWQRWEAGLVNGQPSKEKK